MHLNGGDFKFFLIKQNELLEFSNAAAIFKLLITNVTSDSNLYKLCIPKMLS